VSSTAASIGARPSWHETWASLAATWALRSTCPRASTAAILASPGHRQLASGYNGAPRGLAHCTEVGCRLEGNHCVRALHAEANALLQAAQLGIAVDGATCYCTHRPCERCVALLVQAGIRHIFFVNEYESDDADVARAVAERAGVGWARL
jgi:dCMP deaminase